MATMSEPTSDALFGADGTQPPDPSTGLGRGSRWDAPELPPMSLPPLPELSAMREAIAAALSDDPTGPVDQDPAAAPTTPAEPGESSAAQSGGSPGAQLPAEPAPHATGLPPASAGARSSLPSSHQPLAPPLFSAIPSPRRAAGLRYRPPMAAAFRKPVPPVDLHRRVGRDRRPDVPRQNPANMALGVGLLIASIITVVLLYTIITGILESISRLLQ